jgi:hypothetical protein
MWLFYLKLNFVVEVVGESKFDDVLFYEVLFGVKG